MLKHKLESTDLFDLVDYRTDDFELPDWRIEMHAAKLSGVYFLFSGNELVYIGQSSNISSRVAMHAGTSPFHFDSYSYIECSPGRCDEIEALYTLIFRPRQNVTDYGRPIHGGVNGMLKKVMLDGTPAIELTPPLVRKKPEWLIKIEAKEAAYEAAQHLAA